MLRYAFVDNERILPFPGGRATCPDCGDTLIAVCGESVTHHWRHPSDGDCDHWSENVGPWHLSWQNLIDQDSVEVSLGEHRADIRNSDNIVVELQHSPIKPAEIRDRESYYGNMVWVFDSTFRFNDFHCGEISFFSLGRTKHLDTCQKPIFLDFGDYLVEVIAFSDLFSERCHGFGNVRSHDWFAKAYFDGIRVDEKPIKIAHSTPQQADPWDAKKPYRYTQFKTKWQASDGSERTIEDWTKFLPLNRVWRESNQPLVNDIIEQYPVLANGWTSDSLHRMTNFLNGFVMILDGKIRFMPTKKECMRLSSTVSATKSFLPEIRSHAESGRLPVLQEATFEHLVTLAEQYEIKEFGKLLQSPQQPVTPTLFDDLENA